MNRLRWADFFRLCALVLVVVAPIVVVSAAPPRPIGLVLLYLSAVIAVMSVVAFAVLHPGWYRSSDGQHVMAYMGSLALILAVWSAGALFVTPPWWQNVRMVAFMTLPMVLAWRLILIVRSYTDRRGSTKEH